MVVGFIVLLSFVSVLEVPSAADPSTREAFPGLWDEAGRANGGAAVFALIVAAVLVVLAVIATFRPRLVGPPAGVAVLAALLVLMLLNPPGFASDEHPSLAPIGRAGLVLAFGTLLLGAVHAVHAAVIRRHA
jgi:hypothetical protein